MSASVTTPATVGRNILARRQYLMERSDAPAQWSRKAVAERSRFDVTWWKRVETAGQELKALELAEVNRVLLIPPDQPFALLEQTFTPTLCPCKYK